MEDDDDFTFPTVAAAGPGGRLGSGDVGGAVVVASRMPLQLPVPDIAAAAAPLWPFAGSPKATAPPPSSSTAAVAKDDDEAPASGSNNGRGEEHRAEEEEDDEDRRRRRVAADEERMDLLWAGATTTTTAPPPQSTGSWSRACHSQPPPPPPKPEPEQPRAGADDDKRRAAAVADAERMDKLWESFNEELLLRHALSKAAAADRATDPADRWYLCSHSPSDAESDGTTAASSPAERRGYGCAPTMLRASSRAGGAGQFCGSPRGGRRRGGGGRGAAAGWALLLRLFRRLFAVDKAPASSSSSRSHASIYVP